MYVLRVRPMAFQTIIGLRFNIRKIYINCQLIVIPFYPIKNDHGRHNSDLVFCVADYR